MQSGLLGAIELLGELNKNKSDKETHQDVKNIITAMITKKRKLWPSKELRECVNKLDTLSRKYFLETMIDMDEALNEAYELLEEQNNG